MDLAGCRCDGRHGGARGRCAASAAFASADPVILQVLRLGEAGDDGRHVRGRMTGGAGLVKVDLAGLCVADEDIQLVHGLGRRVPLAAHRSLHSVEIAGDRNDVVVGHRNWRHHSAALGLAAADDQRAHQLPFLVVEQHL